MKTSNTIFTKACMVLAATALVNVGCTDDFLKQDPLSFYNPEILTQQNLVCNQPWLCVIMA